MLRELPPRRVTQPKTIRLRRLLGAVTAGALTVSLCLGTAQADDLTDRRDQLEREAEQTKRDLSESTDGLNQAVAALEAAESELAAAQERLAETEAALADAEAKDAEMAKALAAAQQELEEAKVAVADNQLELDQQTELVGEVVRSEYQQRTNLMGVAVILQTHRQADLQTKMQWSTTMFDTTEAQMDSLRILKAKLAAAEARLTEIEAKVAADRQAAADNLVVTQNLQAEAAAGAAEVASLVKRSDEAKAAAEAEVAAEEQRYEELTAERSAVEKRIAERIAAEERKRKAEAQARAERAEAERAAAEKSRKARTSSGKKSSSSGSSRASTPAKKSSGGSAGSGKFQMPVNGPITSKYGMRLHPVTGIYKLHDGTDFGAGCGTPIKAPASGRVGEKYFNAGYGNRLIIDHGRVRGAYVSTIMNHATRYTVSVGDRVSKGQTVGYVGSTGYSTGCHLHLMVTKNGSTVNPMTTGLF